MKVLRQGERGITPERLYWEIAQLKQAVVDSRDHHSGRTVASRLDHQVARVKAEGHAKPFELKIQQNFLAVGGHLFYTPSIHHDQDIQRFIDTKGEGNYYQYGFTRRKLLPLSIVDVGERRELMAWDITKRSQEFEELIKAFDEGDIRFKKVVFYNKIPVREHASDYDPTAREVYGQIHPHVVKTLRKLGVKGRVLDVGCGKGDLMLQILQDLPQVEAYGLEYLESNVERARFRFANTIAEVRGEPKPSYAAASDNAESKEHIRQGDAMDLSAAFPDIKKFDAIVASGLITNQVSTPEEARKMFAQWPQILHRDDKVIACGLTDIIVTPDQMRKRFRILQTCVRENLFDYKEPKEFYVLERR